MQESWPLYKSWRRSREFKRRCRRGAMTADKMVFRTRADRPYTSAVFYDTASLRHRWGRLMKVLEVRCGPTYQDVIVLQRLNS